MVTSNHIHLSREARDFASSTCVDAGGRGVNNAPTRIAKAGTNS